MFHYFFLASKNGLKTGLKQAKIKLKIQIGDFIELELLIIVFFFTLIRILMSDLIYDVIIFF